MISRLHGILIAKQAPAILLEVSGISYEVLLPINNFYRLPQLGEELTIHTHFIVKENEQSLYGFIDEKQRSLFRILIKVNGVGPKTALTILSGIEPEILVTNILHGEVSNLVRMPGIGAKTAQRLVMELRDKVEELHSELEQQIDSSTIIRDAISALIALGYKPQEAQRAITKHKDKTISSEELIRLALREM